MQLSQLRIAVIASDGFEEMELTEPVRALQQEDAQVTIFSIKKGDMQAFRHQEKSIKVKADKTFDEMRPGEFDAVMLPGGALNADTLRAEPKVLDFLRKMDKDGKPIAAICHAPWLLISAGLVRGRKLTAYHTIADDIKNAGGNFVDQDVIVDRNWVTSRQPSDLPAFNREMVQLFSHVPAGAAR